MNNPWRFFIVVEALLFTYALWQVIHRYDLVVMLVIGVFFVYFGSKKDHIKNFFFVVGILLLIICALNISALWFMLVFAILFVGIKGIEISGVDITKEVSFKKQQIMMIETANLEERGGRRFKRSWFKNERIGSNVYEWDDININILSGDTIIDLGNTLLPKNDNVIIVRKGFGRTRVLVPLGIAIQLEHSTFYGNVIFEDELYHLKNESLKLYSADFDNNQRRLKIVTNSLVGDVEVIRV